MMDRLNNIGIIGLSIRLTTIVVVSIGIKKGIELGADRLIPYVNSLIAANTDQAERLEEILYQQNLPNPIGLESDEEWDVVDFEEPPHVMDDTPIEAQPSIISRVRSLISGMNLPSFQ